MTGGEFARSKLTREHGEPLPTSGPIDTTERELAKLTGEFGTAINAWLLGHELREHQGGYCARERGNILAYIAHRMGCTREVLIIMIERLADYEAIHQEHDHGH